MHRLLLVELVPAVVHLELGGVVVVGGVHRPHEGDVVDARRQVRPPVADLDARLAVLLEPDLEREDLRVGPVVAHDGPRPLLEQGRLQRVGKGVSSYVLPAYRFSAGLGSQVSRWLTPPERKIQMTLFVFGREMGPAVGRRPGGAVAGSARTIPSRWSIAPRARPVNPKPTSARNVRRRIRPQGGPDRDGSFAVSSHQWTVRKSLWLNRAWTRFSRARERGLRPETASRAALASGETRGRGRARTVRRAVQDLLEELTRARRNGGA